MKNIDFTVINCSLGQVASILPVIKNFATKVKFPYFSYTDSEELLKIIKTFLEGNTVLSNLSIEVKQFKPEERITEFFEIIGNNKTLNALDLSNYQLGNGEIQVLAKFLVTNDTLTELNISKNHYDANSARALLYAIRENHVLKKLIISQSDKINTYHADDLKEASDKRKLEVIYLPE